MPRSSTTVTAGANAAGRGAIPNESHLWLPEHEVRDGRLPVPIDQRNGGHVERDVQNHWKPELPGDCVDRAEHQPSHRRLLYPG